MCEYVMIYGGCCVEFVSGPWDWIGFFQLQAGSSPYPAVAGFDTWPNYVEEAAYVAMDASRRYATEDMIPVDGAFHCSYDDSPDEGYSDSYSSEAEITDGTRHEATIIGSINALGGDTWYTIRNDLRDIEYDTNLLDPLASWTEGADADFASERLETTTASSTSAASISTSLSLANGWYEYRLVAEAAEATWLLIDFANPDSALSTQQVWWNTSTKEIGDAPLNESGSSGFQAIAMKDESLRIRIKVSDASAPSTQTITLRLVDGDSATTYDGTSGDGITITSATLHATTVTPTVEDEATSPEFDLACFTPLTAGLVWRRQLSGDFVVDVGADPEFEGTHLDTMTELQLITTTAPYGGSRLPGGTPEDYTGSGAFVHTFPPNYYPQCWSASSEKLGFYLYSDGDNSAPQIGLDSVLAYSSDALPTVAYGVRMETSTAWRDIPWEDAEYAAVLPGDNVGDRPGDIGDANDIENDIPRLVITPPRAFPLSIGVYRPRLQYFEYGTPVTGTGSYLTVGFASDIADVTQRAAITCGPYREITKTVVYTAEEHYTVFGATCPFITGPTSILWEDDHTQTRVHDHNGISQESETRYTRGILAGDHVALSLLMGDCYGSSTAAFAGIVLAIYTEVEMTLEHADNAPWESPVVPLEPDRPAETGGTRTHWLIMAAGAPGATGTANERERYQIWRIGEDEKRITAASCVEDSPHDDARMVYCEFLYDADPPDAADAGTIEGFKTVFLAADGTEDKTLDSTSPFTSYSGPEDVDCVDSSAEFTYWRNHPHPMFQLAGDDEPITPYEIPNDGATSLTRSFDLTGWNLYNGIGITIEGTHDTWSTLSAKLVADGDEWQLWNDGDLNGSGAFYIRIVDTRGKIYVRNSQATEKLSGIAPTGPSSPFNYLPEDDFWGTPNLYAFDPASANIDIVITDSSASGAAGEVTRIRVEASKRTASGMIVISRETVGGVPKCIEHCTQDRVASEPPFASIVESSFPGGHGTTVLDTHHSRTINGTPRPETM